MINLSRQNPQLQAAKPSQPYPQTKQRPCTLQLAAAATQKTTQTDPQPTSQSCSRAPALSYAPDTSKKQKLLRPALEKDPDDHHIAEILAQALMARGADVEALALAQRIVKERNRNKQTRAHTRKDALTAHRFRSRLRQALPGCSSSQAS